MRQLIAALAELNEGDDPATFGRRAASAAAALLEAGRVVIVIVPPEGGAHLAGAYGPSPEDLAGEYGRCDLDRAGHATLAVPLGGAVGGALLADRRLRHGPFDEQDVERAHLLAQYVAAGLDRISARDAEILAASRLRATVEAIQDGVLVVDAGGRVSLANAAAERMLRTPVEAILRRRLADVAGLAPVAAALASRELPDGAVVRLPHGSVVLAGRRVGAGDGVVLTLAEIDRAQRIAHHIRGARARYGFPDITGRSPALLDAVRLARQAAEIDASVLVTGESGTGKEVLAQAIHSGGPRAAEPFVGINCAALPRELLEAELFGYERGAFTGARGDGNPGKFELAGSGTILLDEIGDMPLDMQAKLLRVLQERVVVRLGGSNERPVRARIIATTHRDLAAAVAQGTFRMDLLFRLRVIAIHLPALRERGDDVEELARQHLLRVARQQHKRVEAIAPNVLGALRAHAWPGNVRELANVIEREVSLLPADARVLEALSTPLVVPPHDAAQPSARRAPPAGTRQLLAEDGTILPLAEIERRAFLFAYEQCEGNVARAAKALGVSKVTFYAKLKQWGPYRNNEGPPSSRSSGEVPPSSGRDPNDTH